MVIFEEIITWKFDNLKAAQESHLTTQIGLQSTIHYLYCNITSLFRAET